MALLHKATMNPTKRDLMATWLARRPWAAGLGELKPVAAYRFDDPEGEVGLEGALLGDPDGQVVHVPVTYRGAPLDGAEEFLVGTTEHSVLGPRWVYDACGDPVWAEQLMTVIATGGGQAEQYFEVAGRREVREPSMTVSGGGLDLPDQPSRAIGAVHDDGETTVTRYGDLDLVVVRRLGAEIDAEATLTGGWGNRSGVLAGLRRV
jgi:Maltokinase N-terminal cap domain